MLHKFQDDPVMLKNFEISYCSSKYLEALIDDIIDLSKIKLNKFKLNLAEENIKNLMQEVIDILKPMA
jgi:signal transduction histidine kinase